MTWIGSPGPRIQIRVCGMVTRHRRCTPAATHAILAAMSDSSISAAPPSYAARLAFVVELAERLHTYGTTAQRLEGALDSVAASLEARMRTRSNPTGLILTFSDPSGRPAKATRRASSACRRAIPTWPSCAKWTGSPKRSSPDAWTLPTATPRCWRWTGTDPPGGRPCTCSVSAWPPVRSRGCSACRGWTSAPLRGRPVIGALGTGRPRPPAT